MSGCLACRRGSLPSGGGARKTGKSTYLRTRFPGSICLDLLKTDVTLDLTRRPALLRERLAARTREELARPIIIDEVRKVPALLDELHWLIESRRLQFIPCGSNARKLKRGKANLLGGRAWRYEMFPERPWSISSSWNWRPMRRTPN
ncbi:MAG: AAA family ATPase [Patescibacteria group bacterium]|nr:AAA family ATPase [Patescibacteria group bacterium]